MRAKGQDARRLMAAAEEATGPLDAALKSEFEKMPGSLRALQDEIDRMVSS